MNILFIDNVHPLLKEKLSKLKYSCTAAYKMNKLEIEKIIHNYDGIILRSKGYAEADQAISEYEILSDGILLLLTNYKQTMVEERIWFVHQNVRCRSSVIKSKSQNAVLQTSFASEIRRINP